jgi:hypothetical protein
MAYVVLVPTASIVKEARHEVLPAESWGSGGIAFEFSAQLLPQERFEELGTWASVAEAVWTWQGISERDSLNETGLWSSMTKPAGRSSFVC